MEGKDELLSRHYSTIGIGDVFLSSPPHDLPSKYLSKTRESDDAFTSWEIVGTIKKTPEDFIVREIAQQGRKIRGMTSEEIDSCRIADLNTEKGQGVGTGKPREGDQAKGSSISEAKLPTEESVLDVDLSREHGQLPESSIGNPSINLLDILKSSTIIESPDEVWLAVQKLDENAKGLISQIMKRATISSESASTDEVVITPECRDGKDQTDSGKLDRGTFHKAFRDQFPLLVSETKSVDIFSGLQPVQSTKRHKIVVSIDRRFHGMIPYLHDPNQDLVDLYAFFKLGYEATQQKLSNTNSHVPATKVKMRLRPGLPRSERRGFHEILSKGSGQLLDSTTIPDYPLTDDVGERLTTAAIVVSWSKVMKRRMSKKRKLEQSGEVGPTRREHNFLFVLQKNDLEHLAAFRLLARSLRCRQSDLQVAGMKDMKAITYQFCTVSNVSSKSIVSARKFLENQPVSIGPAREVDWKLKLGSLEGNWFQITTRDLRRVKVLNRREATVALDEAHLSAMIDRVRANGFVNFYGEQRVGIPGFSDTVGVRGCDIGRAMLQQNFEQAVDLLMTGRTFVRGYETESEDIRKFREVWKNSGGDPEKAWKALPRGNVLLRERAVLKGLKRYGKDKPLEALRYLNWNERMYYIHAYQSNVWNQVASKRLERYGPVVVEGDLVLARNEDGTEHVKVVGGCELLSWTLRDVVLPLPGVGIDLPQNDVGGFYVETLKKHAVSISKDGPAEAVAKGSYRRLVADGGEINCELIEKDKNGEVHSATIAFKLPKGSFATMLLRELMVTTVTRSEQCTQL